MDRNSPRTDGGGTGRRSFLRGATTLLAAGALGTSVTSAAADDGNVHTTTRRIETWDGKELATRLFVPGDGYRAPYPGVLMTHGYGGDKEGGVPARMGPKYAQQGYLVLTYDSRGFGESDGEVGVDGPKEVNDARALLDWLGRASEAVVGGAESTRLVQRDGSPGRRRDEGTDGPGSGPDIRVGMDGLSYAGGIQLNTAAVDDRLDAIVPRWAWNDLVYSLAPNGGVKSAWATILQEFGAAGSRGVQSGDNRPNGRDVRNGVDPNLYRFYAESAATNDFSPAARSFFGIRSPSTKEPGLADNAPPSLLITGWNDTLFTATETVRNHELLEAGADSRMVFMRGGHSLERQAPVRQEELDRMALTWTARHVGGEAPEELPEPWSPANARGSNPGKGPRRAVDIPEVTYWQDDPDGDVETGGFETVGGLPSAGDGPTRALADASNAGSGSTELAGGPAPGSNSEVLVQGNDDYVPGTFADFDYRVVDDTELLGIPEVTLSVTPLGRDPLVFAKLSHVTDEGAELIYNQATPYEVEGPVGESQEVTFELAGIERQLAAEDTLRLTLSTTDAAYFNSRTSAGVRIDNEDSVVRLPVRGESGLESPTGAALDASLPDSV